MWNQPIKFHLTNLLENMPGGTDAQGFTNKIECNKACNKFAERCQCLLLKRPSSKLVNRPPTTCEIILSCLSACLLQPTLWSYQIRCTKHNLNHYIHYIIKKHGVISLSTLSTRFIYVRTRRYDYMSHTRNCDIAMTVHLSNSVTH